MKIKKVFKYIIIPFLFLLFWYIALLFIVPEDNFFTISSKYSIKEIQKSNNDGSIQGEFESKYNNLGIIGVSLEANEVLKLDNNDYVHFKIKKKENEDWDYENKYAVNQLENSISFPFGFPSYQDSENKLFIYKLNSEKNAKLSKLFSIDNGEVITANYVFLKEDLIQNPFDLLNFLIIKIESTLKNVNLLYNSIPFLLPFILYISVLIIEYFSKTGKLAHINGFDFKKYKLFHLLIAFIFLDFYVGFTNFFSLIFIIIIPIWMYLLNKYKLDSSITFLYTLIIFILAILAIVFDSKSLTQLTSTWIFILFLIGGLQLLYEIYKNKKKKIDYKQYLKIVFGVK